tara:strand:+ start:1840 stop:2238 length:399 start_codon:yes stop_codon:yes gene_type:complete
MTISNYKKNKIVKAITDGYTLVKACEDNNVSRATFYRHMDKDNDLSDTVKSAQRKSAEKALEDVEDMYQDSLHGRKRYDPNLLRDYASHVRWKVQKVLPDRFGEAKQRTGVEISDGTLRVVWETDGSSKDSI